MKIHGFLICLFLCFMPMLCIGANNTTDGDSQVLNINDLVDVAIKNNPRLLVARSIMDGKRGQVTQIRSQYLPHITFDGDIGRRHVEDETLEDDVDNVVHNGVSAAQLLTDFGNTSGAISSSNSRLNAAKSDYQQVGADIVLRIKSPYYQYWQKNLLISVAADQVENYKKHLYRAEEYLRHGIRTKIDVINAQVELSSSELTLRKRQYDKQIALLELEKELGLQPNNGNYSVYVDEGEIDKLVTILPPLPPSLENLLTMASGQRPDLKSANSSVIAANEEVRSVKADVFTQVIHGRIHRDPV